MHALPAVTSHVVDSCLPQRFSSTLCPRILLVVGRCRSRLRKTRHTPDSRDHEPVGRYPYSQQQIRLIPPYRLVPDAR